MKLTLEEAHALLRDGTPSQPVDDALERVLTHDGSFDPRGGNLRFLMRRYHDQDQLLYEPYTGFIDHSVPSDPSCDVVSLCAFCAAPIHSVPFFTALCPWGEHWEVCCECFDVVHRVAPRSVPFSMPLLSVCSLVRRWAALARCLNRCLGWFRRSGRG